MKYITEEKNKIFSSVFPHESVSAVFINHFNLKRLLIYHSVRSRRLGEVGNRNKSYRVPSRKAPKSDTKLFGKRSTFYFQFQFRCYKWTFCFTTLQEEPVYYSVCAYDFGCTKHTIRMIWVVKLGMFILVNMTVTMIFINLDTFPF